MVTRYRGWISPEHYEAFKRLMPDEPDLPDTYDEWLNIAEKEVAEIRGIGHTVKKINLDPDEFTEFCQASSVDRNAKTFHAFTVFKASRKKK